MTLVVMLCVCITPARAQGDGASLVVAEEQDAQSLGGSVEVVGGADGPTAVYLSSEQKVFRPQQLILPSALIAVGAFGVNNGWFCSVKESLRDDFQDWRGDSRFRADDYMQYLPVAANLGLGLLGAKGRHPLREQVAATATAYAAMGIMVNVTKHTVKEKRPDSNSRNSFPSGHTATAFMGAELVREEYGNGYGAGAYAFATGIAVLRLYNDRHWLNDVIAGAGVGILAARVGYWLLPWERKLFGWDKSKTTVTIVPTYDTTAGSFGVSMAAVF